MKGFAFGLVLKQRQKATWKWPICLALTVLHNVTQCILDKYIYFKVLCYYFCFKYYFDINRIYNKILARDWFTVHLFAM